MERPTEPQEKEVANQQELNQALINAILAADTEVARDALGQGARAQARDALAGIPAVTLAAMGKKSWRHLQALSFFCVSNAQHVHGLPVKLHALVFFQDHLR